MKHRLRLRLADESGFSLSEMLVVLVVLGVVLAGLSQLFSSAIRAESEQAKRFQAQQEGRLALDALRRELHCANAVTSTQSGGGWPSSAIKINLGSYCTSGSGDVTWCTNSVSANRYLLRRVTPALAVGAACTGGTPKADYLTTNLVFTALSGGSGTGSKSKLTIDLPVDLDPADSQRRYELKDDIVLRNTLR